MTRRILATAVVLAALATATASAAPPAGITYTFSEVAVPAGSGLRAVTVGPDGAIWYAAYGRSAVGRVAADGTVTEIAVGGTPAGIATGPDGALWVTDYAGNAIVRVTTDGQVQRFALPDAGPGASRGPTDIVAGPGGALWFVETAAPVVGRMTLDGAVTEYPQAQGRTLNHITLGADDSLWVSDPGANAVWHLRGSDGTSIGGVTLPTPNASPRGLVTDRRGIVWVVESTLGRLARIDAANGVSEVANGAGVMNDVGVGPDGALYATSRDGGGVDGISRTDGGPLERTTTPAGTDDVVRAPDGALWMTEPDADRLLRVQVTVSRCLVPRLSGRALAQARRLLTAAHCRLGTVRRRTRSGRTRVIGQRPRPGVVRPAGTTVNVTLGRS